MREAGRCLRCDYFGCGSMVGGRLYTEWESYGKTMEISTTLPLKNME